ncbi:MAG: MjaI family restriction endonuclease [Thermoanaerobaculaceae bacterium]|nr:MjaI family restriction endonuclease [Thermoanaerobaculaceae bacterium]
MPVRRITTEEIRNCLEIQTPNFESYVAPLINLANQYAQGTRPRVVGQMTELIQQFEGETLEQWRVWYLDNHPQAIERATSMILTKLEDFKYTLNNIDEDIVREWVTDLVIVKTFIGLRIQEAILRKIAEIRDETYRIANAQEEAQGIDGFIGEVPVSIKPYTYRNMPLQENIQARLIYYQKVRGGIEVDSDLIPED